MARYPKTISNAPLRNLFLSKADMITPRDDIDISVAQHPDTIFYIQTIKPWASEPINTHGPFCKLQEKGDTVLQSLLNIEKCFLARKGQMWERFLRIFPISTFSELHVPIPEARALTVRIILETNAAVAACLRGPSLIHCLAGSSLIYSSVPKTTYTITTTVSAQPVSFDPTQPSTLPRLEVVAREVEVEGSFLTFNAAVQHADQLITVWINEKQGCWTTCKYKMNGDVWRAVLNVLDGRLERLVKIVKRNGEV
jgi:hypothetical protein